MRHSTISVTASNPQADSLGWPEAFDIEVDTDPFTGEFYGNCHLGCSKNYPTIEAMVHDLLHRHGYSNVKIV